MNTKKDPIDIADTFASDLAYMRTLLHAMEDKVQFYLSNRALLGSREELLLLQAREMDDLLALTVRFLDKLAQELGAVTDLLYSIEPAPAA